MSKNQSLNAYKHGCTSKRLLLPDEDRPRWEALLEGMWEEYQPETPVDCRLVGEAARAIWNLERNNQRFDEYEQKLHGEQPDSTQWTTEQWHQLELRTRYRTTAERSWMRALRGL